MSAAVADLRDLTPAEAVEVLHTRDLWPWSPGDDAAPRWWCERCQGCGWLPGWQHCGCVGEPEREYGHTADPPTLAALVAVASLGVSTLRTAEELARVLVGRAPRIVWRVMTREALREHHTQVSKTLTEWVPTAIFSRESYLRLIGNASWPEPFPYGDRRSEAVWPVLRDIEALGLHLVALDGDRITLAVESIGGAR